MSTLKTINVVHPSSSTNNIITDANGNVTVGGTVSMASSFLRNRVINGAMEIDQRNAGASVTPTGNQYTLDRWSVVLTQSSKFSVQQNAGSVTPPAGFTNYLGITSLSAYSVLSTDTFIVEQTIEGLNFSDLAFGTASAKTITISFWVRSSLTGTFGGSLANSDGSRSYPFSYSVGSANTWTQIAVAITGDTSGTWLTTNGIGARVRFGLGSGSTYTGTANAWGSANVVQPTSTVSVVGTNGATFYITGVQLEVGSVATPFERRLYSQELAMCLRYYQYYGRLLWNGYVISGNTISTGTLLPVIMRANPTVTATYVAASNFPASASTVSVQDAKYIEWYSTASGTAIGYFINAFSLSAEL